MEVIIKEVLSGNYSKTYKYVFLNFLPTQLLPFCNVASTFATYCIVSGQVKANIT